MRLFDASNTRRVGTVFVERIFRSSGTLVRGTLHCTGTYMLAGGTLSFNFAGGKAETRRSAITDGSGVYEALSRKRG